MKKIFFTTLLTLSFSQMLFAVLPAPALVTPQNASAGQEPNVLLDWSPVTSATGYEYRIATNPSMNDSQLFSISGTSQASTSNLDFGTTYYWQVRARKTSIPVDSSDWSVTWNFSTLDQLIPLSPLSQSTGNVPDVLLDWAGISGITAYDYQWDTTANFNSPISYYNSVSSSQVGTFQLRFGTKYFWRVRARHAADTSQWSAVWNFSTLDQLIPLAPLSQSAGNVPDVLLDWAGISGQTAYDYQWDTSANFNSPISYYNSVSSSQVGSFQLRFGTKYFWRVRARHAADTSQWSAVWNFSTLDQLIPLAPLSQTTGTVPDVLLDWAGISGNTAYDYQWDTTANFNSPISYYNSVSSSQVGSFQLRFGTKYYWRVRARHAADTSQWSSIWNFSTLASLALLAPTNGAANTSLNPQLDWAGISGITAYQYRYSPNADFGNASLLTATASQTNLINLLYGTSYFWQVRACHGADTSDWNPAWSFTTLYQISSAPLLLSPANATLNVPFTGTSLQWSTVPTASFYEYLIDDEQTFTSPISGTETGTSASTGDLMPSTTYFWKVRAGNGSGFSAWSEVRSFNTGAATEVAEGFQQGLLRIYPNPTNGLVQLSIEGKSVMENGTGGVYSFDGKQVHEFHTGSASSQIDLKHHPKGMYVIRIRIGDEVFSRKIVLQ